MTAYQEKVYRTEIPNIIDELGLDPYERTLYVHYKKVCGADGGQCTEGVRRIADKTRMSIGKIPEARQGLLDQGLIKGDIQQGKESTITIVDIWDINTAYWANENRPNVDGWTVDRLREWIANCSPGEQLPVDSSPREQLQAPIVHIVNNKGSNCSYSEQIPLNCSPGEQKNRESLIVNNISPNGDSGKMPPEVNQSVLDDLFEPEASGPTKKPLEPDTPETCLLFEKFNCNRQAEGRRPAKKFKTLEQKSKCIKAAERLGYEKFSEGLLAGLEQGITRIDGLVNWLAKYGKNGYHPPRGQPSDTSQKPMIDLSSAFKAKARN